MVFSFKIQLNISVQSFFSEVPNVIIEEKPNSWDLMDIMNNVTSVHNCMDHQNQKYGMGTAFDSLNREK